MEVQQVQLRISTNLKPQAGFMFVQSEIQFWKLFEQPIDTKNFIHLKNFIASFERKQKVTLLVSFVSAYVKQTNRQASIILSG